MQASLPSNEPLRLDALRRYRILDTPTEEIFDGITRLVAYICDVPIVVINLIDEGRQWFKSEIGLGVRQTPLDISICAHAILQPGLFEVPDTRVDPRFADNPLVTAAQGLRFYAGALLKASDGYALGTLCVLDRKPRTLTPAQRDTLQTLAQVVMSLFELRRSHHEQLKIVHDFANLAAGIHGVAEDLLERATLPADQREDLDAIFKAAERSVKLTREFRKLSASPAPVDRDLEVNAHVTDTAQMVQRFLRSDILIELRLTNEKLVIEMDSSRFEQILLNLLLNARDAMPQGGKITVTTAASGPMVRLTVKDSGQGISKEVLPHIFETFFTTKKVGEGTGLGLATVKAIVEQSGGTISVDSAPNQGAVFTLELPKTRNHV